VIINTFTYANDLRVLLVEDFFPADLLEQLTEMCKTSETHPNDWHNPEWSKLRKIHNGNWAYSEDVRKAHPELFFPDWEHPNRLGHYKIYETVKEKLGLT